MAFKSKPAPVCLSEDVKGSTGTIEDVYGQTSFHEHGEGTEFVGGGWGGWNGGSVTIGIAVGTMRKEKE